MFDVRCLDEGIGKLQEILHAVAEHMEDLVKRVAYAEDEIPKETDETVEILEWNKNSLITDLAVQKAEAIK
jgi:hypothetical protein